MKNYDELRKEWVQARKERKPLLVYVLGGIIDKTQKMAKSVNSDDLNSFVEQAIKSEHKQYLDSLDKGIEVQDEINLIATYLPETLSEATTHSMISNFLLDPRMKFPDVMKYAKTVEGFDMKIVQKVAKELLSAV